MSKANPNSIINRREAIASVAALAAVPAGLALSKPAASACVPDPIIMLIEEHRAARFAFSASLDPIGKYQEANRLPNGSFPPRADHPALVELERLAAEWADREQAATVALLTTAPTTLGCATALLRYIADNNDDDYLTTDCGEAGNGYDALVSSLIVTLAPPVQK